MADEGFPLPGVTQITDVGGWEGFFSATQESGVIFGLEPSLNSGARTVSVAIGSAFIRGFYKPNSGTLATGVPGASAQNRVDRLVCRLNRSATLAADFIKFVILQGTSGSTTPPALTQVLTTTGIWEQPICRWTSASNGTLSGLVDERHSPWGWFTSGARTAGLVPPYPARVAVELDTGRVWRGDNAAWHLLTEDTGWVSLPLNGPNASAWSLNTICRTRRVNGVVQVRIAVKRWDSSPLPISDTDGSVPIILPTGFAPTVTEYGSGIQGRSPVMVQAEPGGNLRIIPMTQDIPAGRTVVGGVTFLAG